MSISQRKVMPQFRLTKTEEEKLSEQFEKWKSVLNWKVAPAVIACGLAALPLPEYRLLIGIVGFFVLFATFVAVKNHFPSIFKELRLKERSFKEEIIYRGISSYYFSFKRSFRHFPVYWVAIVLLTGALADIPSLIGL
ncbi:hypothetical protein L2755_19960 [Shewanella abyssi]|uniref:hypothetical protein n=1 Tax=Shewanella abyssi TaxID=311789 RepID=UPI00200DDA0F|nr:hypothetical protein [Shewanella abyssi]MCL1051882.1 hypothetical protein [Shewanella abyssi]